MNPSTTATAEEPPPAPPGDPTPVCTFKGFNKRRQQKNIRKREIDDSVESSSGNEGGAAVIRVQKAKKESALGFSTAGAGSSHQREARFAYTSSRIVQQDTDNGATRQLETETQTDRDARALREQVLAQQAEGAEYQSGVYKGMNNYRDYRAGFRREHTVAAEKGGGSHGPLRANTTVRGTFIMDYKPDICKDYKETGTCGFGDSCKFMHDRGDYKSGWELDREWEEKEKQRKRQEALKALNDDEDEDQEEDEDDLPFACFICRESFADVKDPVVTRCKHYFCEHCALKHFQSSKNCAVCEEPTGGVFNVAKDIIKKFKEKKAAAKKRNVNAEEEDKEPLKRMALKAAMVPQGQSGGWVIPSGGGYNLL